MSTDFHDFDLPMNEALRTEDLDNRDRPYACRAYRSAIEEAGGPIPEGKPLAEAFDACSEKIHAAGQSKIAAQLGMVDEPVAIVAADILP